jgi:RNA polymerase sigma-70 factor (ECF subfamily)
MVPEGLSVKPASAVGWSEVASRDAVLAQRCAAGDDRAYAELVEEHQRMVVQLAFNLMGDYDDALDVSQEVFLRVFRTIGGFRAQSSLRTWIFRIVVNQARNRQRWWRRRRRDAQVPIEDHIRNYGEFHTTSASDPARAFARKELATRLARALGHLPFEQRTVIVLREVDGLSYDEIAEAAGLNVGTVKSRLARARESLRSALRDA